MPEGSKDLVDVAIRPPAGEGAGSVAVVMLNDPDRRNMLSSPMTSSLVSAFDRIERDGSIGAVVITGAGPAFCAGADLGGLGSARDRAAGSGGSAGAGDGRALTPIYEGFLRVAR